MKKRSSAYWTAELIAAHTPFLGTLRRSVRGWRVDDNGNVGEDVTIPKGAALICQDRDGCTKLLAIYGRDRSVADVVMPNGSIDHFFFRLTDGEKALPREPRGFRWCTPCQAYHATCPVNFGEDQP